MLSDTLAQPETMPSTTVHSESQLPLPASSTMLPDCWTVEQYSRYSACYSWLYANNGKLGCVLCKDVEQIGPMWQEVGVRPALSDEWVSGTVGPYGKSKDAQQASLRKKINRHLKSTSHKAATDITAAREKAALENTVAAQQTAAHDDTCRVFRTAYYVAKNDKPYTDHPDLIDLQKANGASVGRVLHSNVVCTDIIDHISLEMKRRVVAEMVAAKSQMSVLIDESTALSHSSCLIVYVRTTLDENVGPITFFFDILELPGTTADDIELALMNCLYANGFTDAYLNECFMGFASDGASQIRTFCE